MKRPFENIWKSYDELAWTDSILCPPEAASEEAELFCRLLNEHARQPVETVLHLACGAGIFDFTFKRHFQITGADISEQMLKEARRLNPEIHYHQGDMRYLNLHAEFDAVCIPDAIGYMSSIKDLRKAISTAMDHLKSDGTLLIAAQVRERFQENNFVYSGSRGNVEITLFENNYIPKHEKDIYEAVMMYLIREHGALEIVTDQHILGLFSRDLWYHLFDEFQLDVTEEHLDHLYDQYVLEGGTYSTTVFLCRRKQE